MAAYIRRTTRNEEDESVFISMTDIMISLLFVVILLMAFFAMQIRNTEPTIARSIHDAEIRKRDRKIEELNELIASYEITVSELRDTIELRDATIVDLRRKIADLDEIIRLLRISEDALKTENQNLKARIEELLKAQQRPLDDFLAGIARRKRDIMQTIADRIRESAGIRVHVDHRQGIIRFDNRDLFASGEWRARPDSQRVMEAIAEAIAETLPCFTTGPHSSFSTTCNHEFAIIDAIQIEGHTDDQPTSGKLLSEFINDNFELSVRRATTTYRTMVAHKPELTTFNNAEEPAQPVLSVSGYGETRPIADNETETGRELNRRIDLRFIMMTPQSLQQVEDFKKRLLGRATQRETDQ